ncbi:hypothetical protein E2C01_000360 [Portunus trituberculatus]|uniref:Uncharacterized protein n=1 Tax=Portunus trituberculatus TaxID=210409 RepID=A0A5B7CJE4_PORTR|nr:hypothetical protein [Portunus trituberculatus]
MYDSEQVDKLPDARGGREAAAVRRYTVDKCLERGAPGPPHEAPSTVSMFSFPLMTPRSCSLVFIRCSEFEILV